VSPALVLAAITMGACQDRATLELFPTRGTSGTSAAGAAAGGTGAGGAGTGGGMAGVGTGGGGIGGAGATSGNAGTQAAASGTGGTLEPVGGEGGEAGADVTEGGAGGVGEGGVPVVPSTLVHRYDFSGTGTVVPDLVGGADAIFENGALIGDGRATLNGTNQYIELPAGIISVLRSATFVIWFTWAGEGDWERVFDFGNNDGTGHPGDPDDTKVGQGITTFWLTPRNVPGPQMAQEAAMGFQRARGVQNLLTQNFSAPLGANVDIRLAIVIDLDRGTTAVYRDGASVLSVTTMDPARIWDLSLLDDQHNWLGRSQWSQDQVSDFEGSYDEFRIYASALDAAAIAELVALGPDVLP
jgi:hypothetical protein